MTEIRPTLLDVLMKYINEDTFVWIGKHSYNESGEHYSCIKDCISLNIKKLNKRVKFYHYYIDGLLEIVLL